MTNEEFRKLTSGEQRRHRDALRGSITAQMNERGGIIENFRAKMQSFFEAAIEAQGKKEFERRPNISLRLVMEGQPAGKLILVPRWAKRYFSLFDQAMSGQRRTAVHTADCTMVHCEMMVEEEKEIDGKPAARLRRLLTVNVGGPFHGPGLMHLSALEDFQRVLATMRVFVVDYHKVLSRSRQNCCICGRKLTDELSRCRGVGPECIKSAPAVWFAKTKESLLF
jgi:hypothetical protein